MIAWGNISEPIYPLKTYPDINPKKTPNIGAATI